MNNEESCITHAPKSLFAAIREDYVGICKRHEMRHPLCAAALLNMFERWANFKYAAFEEQKVLHKVAKAKGQRHRVKVNMWIYLPRPQMQEELQGLFGETLIKNSLQDLEKAGFIKSRRNPLNSWDRTLQYLFFPIRVQKALHLWANSTDAPSRIFTASKAQKYGFNVVDLQRQSRKVNASKPQNHGSNTTETLLEPSTEVVSQIPPQTGAPASQPATVVIPLPTESSGSNFNYEVSIGGVFGAYLENISRDKMTPMLSQKITDAVEEFGAGRVLEAIEIAALSGKKFWKYIAGIFDNWREDEQRKQRLAELAAEVINQPVDDTPVEVPVWVNDVHLDMEIFSEGQLLQTPRTLWSAVMGQAELQMDRPAFDTWFHDLKPLDFDAPTGRYTILARNEFNADQMRYRYNRFMSSLFRGLAPMPLLIEYVTLEQWKGMIHATQSAAD